MTARKAARLPAAFAAAVHDFHTLRDLLRFAVSRMNETELTYGHGTANAFDEAVYLLQHALHLPHETLEPFLDALLLEDEKKAALTLIHQRIATRKPAAYLTQEAWFGDRRFFVDERVLIPRSFIGDLLQDGLQPWISDPRSIRRVLDLCTGSGCVAIAVAKNAPTAHVTATDVSRAAIEVASGKLA